MEPCTVRSLFFKCLHGTGQIKILSLSQCIMVVEGSRYVPAVFRRNVRREVEPLFFFANEYFTLLSRWIEEKIAIWRIVNCIKPINAASKASSADATSSLLIISFLYHANIFALYISLVLLFTRGEYFMLVTRWRQYSFHTQSSTALFVQKQDRFQCLHGTGRIRNRSGLKLDLIFSVLQFVRLTVLEFVRFLGFRVNARPNRTNWWTVPNSSGPV